MENLDLLRDVFKDQIKKGIQEKEQTIKALAVLSNHLAKQLKEDQELLEALEADDREAN